MNCQSFINKLLEIQILILFNCFYFFIFYIIFLVLVGTFSCKKLEIVTFSVGKKNEP